MACGDVVKASLCASPSCRRMNMHVRTGIFSEHLHVPGGSAEYMDMGWSMIVENLLRTKNIYDYRICPFEGLSQSLKLVYVQTLLVCLAV
jgi:hypothetical protein